jgi:hypothetical protein
MQEPLPKKKKKKKRKEKEKEKECKHASTVMSSESGNQVRKGPCPQSIKDTFATGNTAAAADLSQGNEGNNRVKETRNGKSRVDINN